MKPIVIINNPESFKVIDVLNTHAVEMGFKLLSPLNGELIEEQVLNLAEIGITFAAPKLVRPMGFPSASDLVEKSYNPQAVLKIVDIEPGANQKVTVVAWEMFLEDAEDLDQFLPIAELLSVEFKRAIVINLFSKDDDSAHMEPEPADPNFPDGPLVCRIVPKTNKEKE